MAQSHGIAIKKQYGQHFLRDKKVVHGMLEAVTLDNNSSVFEIGCGDGFLTEEIVRHSLARLWIFEIDPEWADFVKKKITDPRLTLFCENILDIESERFEADQPWTLLANLPYQITFPILHRLYQMRHLLREGVIMVQEEVAQKIIKTSGRGYGYPSLFFQYYFEWKPLDKIKPTAFLPPPKVDSRLLYFKPRPSVAIIPEEEAFWHFIKICFKQPRRTLKNNLMQTHYDMNKISSSLLSLRAQQLSMHDFLELWHILR